MESTRHQDLLPPTSRRTIDLDPPHRRTTAAGPTAPVQRADGHRSPPQGRLRLRKPDGSPVHPTSAARPSNAFPPLSICPASVYTTCATPTPRSCCHKVSTPKSANASATPASHSPWTSTNTSDPACNPPLTLISELAINFLSHQFFLGMSEPRGIRCNGRSRCGSLRTSCRLRSVLR